MNLPYSINVQVLRNDLFNLRNDFINARCVIHPYNILEINLLKELPLEKIRNDFEYLFQNENNFIYPVNTSGLKGDTTIGSYRISTNSIELASYFTKVLNTFLTSDTEWNDKYYNKVSSYFRFMKYENGGQHFPHYDSNYKIPNTDKETTHSLVMYLDDCEDGELVFCHDNRGDLKERLASNDIFQLDWNKQVTEEEIYFKFKPKAGSIIIFPHELCHSVLPFTGEERRIIRGDLIFE